MSDDTYFEAGGGTGLVSEGRALVFVEAMTTSTPAQVVERAIELMPLMSEHDRAVMELYLMMFRLYGIVQPAPLPPPLAEACRVLGEWTARVRAEQEVSDGTHRP